MMTPTDKKRYDLMNVVLSKWQNKKILKVLESKTEEKFFYNSIADLVERMENLEKLMFWSLLCDAGEQGLTIEQREIMKTTGFEELYEEFQKIMKVK